MEAQSASRQYQITLLQERSAGTSARVYLAEAVAGGISRIVAVKVLDETWAERQEILDRTRGEARLLARLRHSSILRVEALAQIDGQPAIVMEFVDGLDLGKLIEGLAAGRRAVPARVAYRIALDTASALEAAFFKVPHGMEDPLRVVHRDIEPGNIMVSVEGEVKVLDFGTAHHTSDSRPARSGAMRFGSLKYMPPERRRGQRGEHSGDVYALGLVLIEMLRGEMLPPLPLDHREHDDAIAEFIARLGGLSLPNSEWADSLRQTLAGMCAAQAESRLNASQVVQLLRAFEGQASGASLESFAAENIEPLAREAFGLADKGALAGSRIFATLSASEDAAGDLPAAAGADVPATIHRPAPSEPSRGHGFQDPRASVVQPVQPAGQVHALPQAHQEPAPAGRSSPPPDRRQAPVAPAARPSGNRRALVLGAIAVFIGGISVLTLAVLVAAGAWWSMGQSGGGTKASEPAAVATAPAAPAPAAAASAANMAVVELAASDETIQWVRLSDGDGTRLINATPDGSGQLAPGSYELSAKVVARPPVKGELVIGPSGARIVCERAAKGSSVLCTDGVGTVELKP